MKQASHQQADRTYAQLKEQSRTQAVLKLPVNLQEAVKLDDITGRTMAQLSRWEAHPDRRVMWSWQHWPTATLPFTLSGLSSPSGFIVSCAVCH